MNRLFSLSLVGMMMIPGLVSAESSFPDVYETDPIIEALDYLADLGVVEGYDDGEFKPMNLINRAEFTKMIVEGVEGITPDETQYKKCFSDVQGEWYAKYVCYAEEEGWIQGYDDGLFKPADNIMRSEAVKIMAEALDWELTDDAEAYSRFSDIDPNAWYDPYIRMAEERDMFDEIDYFLTPNEFITRKQMSELLYRGMKYEEGDPVEVRLIEYGDEKPYTYWLDQGLTAAYPGDMTFPHHSQSGWTYGCYSFGTKNILEFKYGTVLDIAEVQDAIGWDGSFIWSPTEFSSFADLYNVDVIFNYNNSAEFFMKKLAMGEPMIVYIPYYIGEWNVGHQLAVYSFDENGVWAADSLSGGNQYQIDWADIFVDGANITTNLTELRSVKAEGLRKSQIGI
jgi:hypothetical protein